MGLHVLDDLLGQVRPGVVHREHDSLHIQMLIQSFANQVDGVDQLAQSLEGIVLALDGNQHGIRCHHGIDCQNIQ